MNKTTYTADGSAAEFNFDQKWFRPEDIHTTINGWPADCAVVPMTTEPEYETPEMKAANDLGIAAHFGGRVIFTTPPPAGATISITRKISIDERFVAVLRTAAVKPNDFNSFADWITEYLKDLAADLTGLENIGALSEIAASVAAVQTLLSDTANIATTEQIAAAIAAIEIPEPECVVEHSAPGANPWFRKYKSGWVEQGGSAAPNATSAPKQITLPVAMSGANYTLMAQSMDMNAPALTSVKVGLRTTAGFSVINPYLGSGNSSVQYSAAEFLWFVAGFAA